MKQIFYDKFFKKLIYYISKLNSNVFFGVKHTVDDQETRPRPWYGCFVPIEGCKIEKPKLMIELGQTNITKLKTNMPLLLPLFS